MSTFGSLMSGSHPARRLNSLKRARVLSRRFNDWLGRHPDCQHAATAVGAALEREGFDVKVIGGEALGSDARKPGIHYWLEINGQMFDPKAFILRMTDKSFRYTGYQKEWTWSVAEAQDEGVEECPLPGELR